MKRPAANIIINACGAFVIIVYIIILVCCWLHTADAVPSKNPAKVAHLSIDDVEAFGELINNPAEYNSLFDHPVFSLLKSLHEDYGATFTLYTYMYFPARNTQISNMPEKFRDDFRNSANWLQIGFHWPEPQFNENISVENFKQGFDGVNDAIARFADSTLIAHTLRLHYFWGPDSLLRNLKNVRCLLCADDTLRRSYNLSSLEKKQMYKNHLLKKNGISYRPTDFRMENHVFLKRALRQIQDRDTLVIFTHEWCLDYNKFRTVVKWLRANGYEFDRL